MDNKDREEIKKIIDEQMQTVKADIKKLRSDLDGHFERHLHALERRKGSDTREKRK